MSVWEQRQYDAPLDGRQASQGCERQPSVAVRSIWEDLYMRRARSFTYYFFIFLAVSYCLETGQETDLICEPQGGNTTDRTVSDVRSCGEPILLFIYYIHGGELLS